MSIVWNLSNCLKQNKSHVAILDHLAWRNVQHKSKYISGLGTFPFVLTNDSAKKKARIHGKLGGGGLVVDGLRRSTLLKERGLSSECDESWLCPQVRN